MNVGELVEYLESYDSELPVVVVLEAEGSEVQDGDVLPALELRCMYGQFQIVASPPEEDE